MASGIVVWFGEICSSFFAQFPGGTIKTDAAVRSVTVLGRDRFDRDQTMDLAAGSKDRYRVEALTANTNVCRGFAKPEGIGARYVAVADHSRLGRVEGALAGPAPNAALQAAVVEGRARPADWVDCWLQSAALRV